MYDLNNSIRIEGFAAERVETREVGKTKVARFSVPTTTSRYNKDTKSKQEFTEWHTVEAWGRTADYVIKYLKKGSRVTLEGKMEYNTYEKTYGEGKNAQTVKHTRAIIRANQVTIRNKRSGSDEEE